MRFRPIRHLAAFAYPALASIGMATTIDVTSVSTGSNVQTGCALRDAIEAVNTLVPVGKCPAGQGGNVVNTINIDVDELTFSTVDAHSIGAVLPAVAAGRLLNIYGRSPGRTLLSLANPCGLLVPVYARLLEVNAGASVNVADVDFSNGCPASNDALGGSGGAIANLGTLYLTRSRLYANGVGPSGFGGAQLYQGGAVYNGPDARFIASSVTFDTNLGDGALFVDVDGDSGYASVDASTFVGNEIGGIVNAGALIVTNSTFTGNYGALPFGPSLPASAIANLAGSTLALSFSSFEANLAATQLTLGANSSAWIAAALFKTEGLIPNCAFDIGASSSWYGVSISSDGTCAGGANRINTDPLVAATLADNGGPTQTLDLLSGSPAIGADADCLDAFGDPVTSDQRGFARPSARCDVGAFEADLIFANAFN